MDPRPTRRRFLLPRLLKTDRGITLRFPSTSLEANTAPSGPANRQKWQSEIGAARPIDKVGSDQPRPRVHVVDQDRAQPHDRMRQQYVEQDADRQERDPKRRRAHPARATGAHLRGSARKRQSRSRPGQSDVRAFFPEVGIATLELLERFGHEVVYPHDQICCGQPVFLSRTSNLLPRSRINESKALR